LGDDLPGTVRASVLEATRPAVVVAEDPAGWPAPAGTLVCTRPDQWRADPGRWPRLRRAWGRRPGTIDPGDGALAWADLVGDPADAPRAPRSPDEPAVLAPTGSATGQRRIVTLTHRNLVANAFQARLWVPDVQAGRERV